MKASPCILLFVSLVWGCAELPTSPPERDAALADEGISHFGGGPLHVDAPSGSLVLITNGDNQSALIGADTLPVTLRVEIRDPSGAPVDGVRATWTVTSGGGGLRKAAPTISNGVSSNRWILGPSAGEQTVTVSVPGANTVTFTATAVAGASIRILEGNRQYDQPNDTLPELLRVGIFDAAGQPVQGVLVNWTVVSGGGGLRRSETRTGDTGKAANAWKIGGNDENTQSVTASAAGYGTVTFHAWSTHGPSLAGLIFPSQVYTTQSPAFVDVRFRLIDQFGVVHTQLFLLAGPTERGRCVTGEAVAPVLISGTTADGWWHCRIPLAQMPYDEQLLMRFYIDDAAGRRNEENRGWVMRNDNQAPVITNVVATPTQLWTAVAPDTLTVKWHANDPGGMALQRMSLYESPFLRAECKPGMDPATGTPPVLVSGTIYDGNWSCTMIIQNSDYRLMQIWYDAWDAGENHLHARNGPFVNQNDQAGPVITLFRATPRQVYTAVNPDTVTFTWRARDPAGVSTQLIKLEQSPFVRAECTGVRLSGDALDGEYACYIVLQNAEYRANSVRLISSDMPGNTTNRTDLGLVTENDQTPPVFVEFEVNMPTAGFPPEGSPTGVRIELVWKAVDKVGVGAQVGELWPDGGGGPTHTCSAGMHPDNGTPPILISGTIYNGLWECSIIMRNQTNTGDRAARVLTQDRAGNSIRVTGPRFSTEVGS